jgi:hypothetical protein
MAWLKLEEGLSAREALAAIADEGATSSASSSSVKS